MIKWSLDSYIFRKYSHRKMLNVLSITEINESINHFGVNNFCTLKLKLILIISNKIEWKIVELIKRSLT